jgi:hypothetical protein
MMAVKPIKGSHPWHEVVGCLCQLCAGPEGVYDPATEVVATMLHWGASEIAAMRYVDSVVEENDEMVEAGKVVRDGDGVYWRTWRLN